MILNKGGKLSNAYFLSYLKLVASFRQCSAIEVYDIVFERLFDRDKAKLGLASFQAFETAYEQFSREHESL
ncbi:hypothetical protein [Terribacillus saccharophilus]|uniref:hypothetical protein n=1 Tax=Terribacillus saccharophilus TaxID=361277 RepID=UPI002DC0989F|nr:hypothetical protein [Terribacillus saccharophilus]